MPSPADKNPTVSRRLQALERSLGARLLQRSTHQMRLTVDGERCFARAKALLADWVAFKADLRGAQAEPEGLRLALGRWGQGLARAVRRAGPYAAFYPSRPLRFVALMRAADKTADCLKWFQWARQPDL